jgi:hypothetical protein
VTNDIYFVAKGSKIGTRILVLIHKSASVGEVSSECLENKSFGH